MDDEHNCGTCAFFRELILWNLEGRNTPDYKNPSGCCIYAKGLVHQVNFPKDEFCECWEQKGPNYGYVSKEYKDRLS